MDSILADEPSVHTLPEGGESDSQPAAESAEPKVEVADKDKGETPAPVAAAKEPEKAADDDADEGPMPADLEGFKKALAAARGDKRKARKQWQEAERKLAMFEGQISVLRQQPQAAQQKPAEPKPEDIASKYWEDPIAFVQSAIKSSVPDVDAVAARTRADVSEFYARQAHADYEERKAYFQERASKDPELWREIFASPAPAESLYQKAAAMQEREEFEKNPNAWREAELEKLRVQLLGVPSDKTETVAPKPAPKPIPKSIATARGSGAGVSQAWSGPRSLDQILGH